MFKSPRAPRSYFLTYFAKLSVQIPAQFNVWVSVNLWSCLAISWGFAFAASRASQSGSGDVGCYWVEREIQIEVLLPATFSRKNYVCTRSSRYVCSLWRKLCCRHSHLLFVFAFNEISSSLQVRIFNSTEEKLYYLCHFDFHRKRSPGTSQSSRCPVPNKYSCSERRLTSQFLFLAWETGGVNSRKAIPKLKKRGDLLKIRQEYKHLFTNRKFYSFNGDVVVMISQYTKFAEDTWGPPLIIVMSLA